MLAHRTRTFDRALDKALKKFPRSREFVEGEIQSATQDSGDAYPGFGENQKIRKVRIELPEYNLKAAKGLRFIFLVWGENDIIPILAYKKGSPPQEHTVKSLIKKALSDITSEIRGDTT